MTLARYLYIPSRTHNFWRNSKTLYSSGFPKISTHPKGAKIATTKLGYFSCSTKQNLFFIITFIDEDCINGLNLGLLYRIQYVSHMVIFECRIID